MALSVIRNALQWCLNCFSSCSRKKQKSKAFESAEEVAELSPPPQDLTDTASVHTQQPSRSNSVVNTNECVIHNTDNTSSASEISGEELSEFVELLAPVETLNDNTPEEVIDTVPSIDCLGALVTRQVNNLQVVSQLEEPEISVVALEKEQSPEKEIEREEVASADLKEEQSIPTSCVKQEPDLVCVKTDTTQQEPDIIPVQKDCQEPEIKPVTMETVEQLPASLDDLPREVTLDEEESVTNGTGSMHASTESEGLEDDEDTRGDSPTIETQIQEVKSEQKSSSKEKNKDEKKSKKKEDKTIEHILRALSSLQTTEEKLAALCKKYADLLEDHRILQSTTKQNQRKLSVVTREKDQLQSEHTKAVMAKSKLESLCRELQKHNQVIRQESLQRAREEDEKRKEISNKFQTTITEIQQQMQDHHERNMKLREENQELAGKLKKFIEQYEVREKQVEKVMQHRELEQKLADAKLQQSSAILKEEQERNIKEKELLLLQVNEGTKKSALLEAQLTMYKERYEEFQSTINRSNEMFQKFKTEMDKMTKRIKKLEKDGAQWKNKWENANRALLEMVEEKTAYDKEKPLLLNKIQKLESLCRAMQAERLGRKVLEASALDPSKFEETVSSIQNESDKIPSVSTSLATLTNQDTQSCPADSTVQDLPNCDTESSPSENQPQMDDEKGDEDEQSKETDQNEESKEEKEVTSESSESPAAET